MAIPNPTHYWSLSTRGQVEDTAPGGSSDGTISGATHVVDGKIRGAHSFDGTNDTIDTNYTPPTSAFTISLWLKLDSVSSIYSFATTVNSTSARNGFQLKHHSSVGWLMNWFVGNSVIFTVNEGSVNASADTWYHVVVTYDGEEANMYINNSLMLTGSSATEIVHDGDLLFGQRGISDVTESLAGDISESVFFDSVLTTAQISDLYNSGDGVFWNQVTSEWEEQDSLRNGLVSAWNFNGDALDDVGSNDGTVSGATITQSGKSAQGYDFDSVDYISISDSTEQFNGTDTFSINMWVRFDTVTAERCFMTHRDAANEGWFFRWDNSPAVLDFTTKNTVGVAGAYRCSWSPSVDTWYMITLTHNQYTDVKLYIDGSEQTLTTDLQTGGTYRDTSVPLYIGRDEPNSRWTMDGIIDEPCIWNRALTSTEVTRLYNSDTGKVFDRETQTFIDGDELRIGTVASYSMDENALDNTINNNDGTISGATSDTTNEKLGTGCYDFDGVNDTISTSSLGGVTIQSFSLWFYNDDEVTTSLTGQVLLSDGSVINNYISLGSLAGLATNEVLMIVSNTAGTPRHTFLASTTISVGWHHIVFTWNSSADRFDIYLDGSLQTVSTGSNGHADVYTAWAGLYFGSNADNGSYFDGKIDETTIFNRALSSTEVSSLYNTNTGLAWPYSTTAPPVIDIENAIFFGVNF